MRFNKLVRDKIPDIIRKNGRLPITRDVKNEAYMTALRQKLQEEVDEFMESGAVEELADVLEVIYAIAAAKGYHQDDLEAVRHDKASRRGGFEKGIFLIEVQGQ